MKALNFVIAAATIAATSCVFVSDDDPTLTLFNDSDFVIEELRLADRNDIFFGPDLTGRDVLFPGESIDIDLNCNEYDIFIQDEFAVECVVEGIDVCFNGTIFFITNSLLDFCEFGVRP